MRKFLMLTSMPRRVGLSFQTGIIPIHKAKIGVSAVKIKNQIFILFIFNQLKINTALNLKSVRSQDTIMKFKTDNDSV